MSLKNKTLISSFILVLIPVFFTNMVAHAEFQYLIPSSNTNFIAFVSMIIFIIISGFLSMVSIVKFVSDKKTLGFILLSISVESLIIGILLLSFI